MAQLRRDIAEAEARMRRTFGTRSAIRNLHESLEAGELVEAMLACLYSAGDGLLVLTDRRVISVRDDFSKFRLQAISLADVRALDYAPTVHDGLAVLTDAGRIAVRKMDRADSDAFAAALVARVPSIIVGASRPQTKEPFRGAAPPAPAAPAPPGPSAPEVGPASPTTGSFAAIPPNGSAPVQAAEHQAYAATQAAAAAAAPGAPAGSAAAGASPQPFPAEASPPAPPAPDADKEVLLGVLADLHAKGLLSSEELAAKIAQVASQS